ncbi:MAG: hypothetical protein Q9198_000068 [Flavoplaca austrocitrina]
MASRQHRRTFAQLQHDELFYQGTNPDGSFKLLTDVILGGLADHYMSERYLMAMAMTEQCRVYGRGKLLYVPLPLPKSLPQGAPDSEKEIWDECLQETVELNGFGGVDGGCKAVLAVVPKVYLGWHSALRANGQDTSSWYSVDEERLKEEQCASGEEVVNKLWDMFFENRPGSLIHLDSILRAAAEWQRTNVDWKTAEPQILAKYKYITGSKK